MFRQPRMKALARRKKIVVINGSPRAHSRTGHLLDKVTAEIALRIDAEIHRIDLSHSGHSLLAGLSREGLSAEAEDTLRLIETTDLLVAGTPVYRASYSGAFKHVFDLVNRDALAGKVVLLAATGGTPLHGLIGEHQLRPLFGFFRAITVPTVVFATEDDIKQAEPSDALAQRITRAAQEASLLLSATANAEAPSLALAANA